MLAEFFQKDKILLNFSAKDYKQALLKMLSVSSEMNHAQIIEKIMGRENLMSTTLGKGIMLPRVVLPDKSKSEIVVAINPKGLNVGDATSIPVKIIILFLFSKMDDYPAILAQSLRLLNDSSLRAELLKCQSENEVISAVKEWEEE